MDKIGLRELAAAAGVIGSMLFVGFEIRQNTNAVRGSTIDGIAAQSMQLNLELSMNREWLALYVKVVEDSVPPAELSQVERVQFGWVLATTTRIMENRFRQFQLGILTEETVSLLGGGQNWYGTAWFREYWDGAKPSGQWAPDFMEFMENRILQQPGR